MTNRQYSISGWLTNPSTGKLDSVRVRSDAILSEFERLGKPIPNYLTRLLTHGCSRSNEDFDCLAAALHEFDDTTNTWYRLGTVEAHS